MRQSGIAVQFALEIKDVTRFDYRHVFDRLTPFLGGLPQGVEYIGIHPFNLGPSYFLPQYQQTLEKHSHQDWLLKKAAEWRRLFPADCVEAYAFVDSGLIYLEGDNKRIVSSIDPEEAYGEFGSSAQRRTYGLISTVHFSNSQEALAAKWRDKTVYIA